MACNFLNRQATLIVIISGEFTANWLPFHWSKFWLPQIWSWLRGANDCDTMADNTGHRLPATKKLVQEYDKCENMWK